MDSTPTTATSPQQSVTRQTARGVFWLMLNTLTSRVVGIGGQIVLAWLLGKREFGVFATALTISTLASLVQQTGLGEILIQRSRHFRRWSNPAFWMSLTAGLASGTIIVAIAPFAAARIRQPELFSVMVILATAAPLAALCTVANAKLQLDMRFRFVAMVNTWAAIGTVCFSLLLAWKGFGVYSLALPRPVIGALQAAALWGNVRLPIRLKLNFSRWRYLVGDSAAVIVVNMCTTIVNQGDYVVLGLVAATETLGVYYFSFNLAVQTIVLVTVNVGAVLMPALCRIGDEPRRQLDGFVRACRVLALVGAPLALLQVGLADAGIRAVFAEKWYPAIRVVQILSLGMTFSMIGSVGGTFMQAQGRFQTLVRLAVTLAIAAITMIVVGAIWGEMIGVACAVAIYHTINGPVYLYTSIRLAGGTMRDVARIYFPAIIVAGSATLIGNRLATMVPQSPVGNWIRLAVISSVTAAIYLPAMRRLAPDSWGEASQHFGRLFRLRSRVEAVTHAAF